MSFRLKTVLGIALIEALLLTILVISGLHYLSTSNAKQLTDRAATTAKLVATMTGDAVIAFDLATLDVLVDQAMRNPDITYLRIRSANGTVLSEGGDQEALLEPFVEDQSVEQASRDHRLDVSAPISIGYSDFGRVELGISTTTLDSTFKDALLWMVGIALSEMTLVALLGLALGHYLTRQLMQLKSGAGKVASGDFGYQIPIAGKDELAETAMGFNAMSKALADYAEMVEEARLEAEAGRKLAESTLRDALDSMRDGVLVVSADGTIVLANNSYRAMYHADDDKLLSDASAAFALEAASNAGEYDSYMSMRSQRLVDPAAFPRWEAELKDQRRLLIAQHPMSKGGVVLIHTDVSELYQALEENRELHLELMQRQKSEAIGTLAGGIAHEINTPVQIIADNATFLAESVGEMMAMIDDMANAPSIETTGLKASLDSIDWDYLQDELPKSLADMKECTERVRDLITTFKQFASPNGLVLAPVDLVNVTNMAIETFRASSNAATNHHAIDFDAPSDMPAVPCQIDQINQVLQHLITNAAHAIQDRDTDEPGLISIRLAYDDRDAILEVRDNGCGIPEENLERIYDVLFTTKTPGRGTGAGLSLCQTIITRGHGGRLSVDSEIGIGTCFKITLPLTSNQSAEPI